jgi:malate dehydrogenase (oxaloacetate-decarboxylating)
VLKCPVRNLGDFAHWYTPGVAAPFRAIQSDPARADQQIQYDRDRIGRFPCTWPWQYWTPRGIACYGRKALLFKYLGGVDVIPICFATQDPHDFAYRTALGGLILDDLRNSLPIPVWHDDQQGTATALLAGLIGALKVIGKQIGPI